MTYERSHKMLECRFVHVIHNFPKHARNKYQKRRVDRYESKKQNLAKFRVMLNPIPISP